MIEISLANEKEKWCNSCRGPSTDEPFYQVRIGYDINHTCVCLIFCSKCFLNFAIDLNKIWQGYEEIETKFRR